MEAEALVKAILEKTGSIENITSAINCMTRLRLTVKDDSAIDEEGLKAIEGVLGVIHDRPDYTEVVVGPGMSSKCGDVCRSMGIPSAVIFAFIFHFGGKVSLSVSLSYMSYKLYRVNF